MNQIIPECDDRIPFSELILQEPLGSELRHLDAQEFVLLRSIIESSPDLRGQNDDALYQDFLAYKGDFMTVLTDVAEARRNVEIGRAAGLQRRKITSAEFKRCTNTALCDVLFFVSKRHPDAYWELRKEIWSLLSKRDWKRRKAKAAIKMQKKDERREYAEFASILMQLLPFIPPIELPPTRMERMRAELGRLEQKARLGQEMALTIRSEIQTDMEFACIRSEKPFTECPDSIYRAHAKRLKVARGVQTYMPLITHSFKEQESRRHDARIRRR